MSSYLDQNARALIDSHHYGEPCECEECIGKHKPHPFRICGEDNKGRWIVYYPSMSGPSPLLVGHGKTSREALEHLKQQSDADPLVKLWDHLIDWSELDEVSSEVEEHYGQ